MAPNVDKEWVWQQLRTIKEELKQGEESRQAAIKTVMLPPAALGVPYPYPAAGGGGVRRGASPYGIQNFGSGLSRATLAPHAVGLYPGESARRWRGGGDEATGRIGDLDRLIRRTTGGGDPYRAAASRYGDPSPGSFDEAIEEVKRALALHGAQPASREGPASRRGSSPFGGRAAASASVSSALRAAISALEIRRDAALAANDVSTAESLESYIAVLSQEIGPKHIARRSNYYSPSRLLAAPLDAEDGILTTAEDAYGDASRTEAAARLMESVERFAKKEGVTITTTTTTTLTAQPQDGSLTPRGSLPRDSAGHMGQHRQAQGGCTSEAARVAFELRNVPSPTKPSGASPRGSRQADRAPSPRGGSRHDKRAPAASAVAFGRQATSTGEDTETLSSSGGSPPPRAARRRKPQRHASGGSSNGTAAPLTNDDQYKLASLHKQLNAADAGSVDKTFSAVQKQLAAARLRGSISKGRRKESTVAQ